jgi:hypothetical protein
MCCGRNRVGHQYNIPNHLATSRAPVSSALPSWPMFEYMGRTALTAIGAITGARYRFDRPGARLRVDPRDRPALARVPVLRPVG